MLTIWIFINYFKRKFYIIFVNEKCHFPKAKDHRKKYFTNNLFKLLPINLNPKFTFHSTLWDILPRALETKQQSCTKAFSERI
jgi:hypothetical protein